MEDFCMKSFIDNVILYFSGNTHESSIIKINNERLSDIGEVSFLCNFKAWKNLNCENNCTNILQHFAHTYEVTAGNNTEADIAKEIFERLMSKSKRWPIKIQRCILQKEKIYLFLNRANIMANAIRLTIKHGATCETTLTNGKIFNLKYHSDIESNLTTRRLSLIKNIAEKILNIHGCVISDKDTCEEHCVDKYIFTSKSEGLVDEGYRKYICGVVKNFQSNSKETDLTLVEYINKKLYQLAELNEYKFLEESDKDKELFLYNLANAVVTFELIAVKPSRSVVIGSNHSEIDKSIANTKGALFILYNTARIASIRAKYDEKVLHGDYPSLPNIKHVDFSELLEEEEWELIYNFVFGYSQMINSCVRYEPKFQISPHVICQFLSLLCQKFSVYYHRVKILTEGGDNLIPKMVARLYMLHALEIVLKNTLNILDIKPVSRM